MLFPPSFEQQILNLVCCLAVVRPPPGFEPKKTENSMPVVDDPSIVWSKAGKHAIGV